VASVPTTAGHIPLSLEPWFFHPLAAPEPPETEEFLMKLMKFVFSFSATAIASLALTCSAATLVSDDFSYPDGNLVGNGLWVAHSGAGSNPVQVAGGQAVLVHGSGSREDASIPFADVTGGILTASFDMVVTDDTPITGTTLEYFAHFFTADNFNFTSRLDVVPATMGGDYALGLATLSATAETITDVDFTYGETVAVELSYNFASGLASLVATGINGTSTIASTTVGTESLLNRFALRQANSGNDETITIDNLVISAVPEPATAYLALGACLAGVVAMRRRLG
jgi:hypothetical protein